jgi:hypothetical protein
VGIPASGEGEHVMIRSKDKFGGTLQLTTEKELSFGHHHVPEAKKHGTINTLDSQFAGRRVSVIVITGDVSYYILTVK